MKNYVEILILLIMAVCMFILGITLSFNDEVVNVTVTDKVVKMGAKSSKYLIFTDKETFKNTDNIFRMKFNSSDYYGKIEVGKNYEFTVVGFRLGFFSSYRNIIKMEKIE